MSFTLGMYETIPKSWFKTGTAKMVSTLVSGAAPPTYYRTFQKFPTNWENTRQGVKTENWLDLIRQGVSVTTPYERKSFAVIRDESSPLQRISRYYLWDGSTHVLHRTEEATADRIASVYFDSLYYRDTFTNVEEDTNVSNAAFAEFRAKIFDARNKVLTGTYAKEWRETLEMLRSPAAGLIHLLANVFVKKAKRKLKTKPPGRSAAKILSDLWLEYKFGWKPLVGDIESALQVVAQWKEGLKVYDRCVGSAEKCYAPVSYNHPISGDFGLQLVGFRQRNISRRTRYGGLVVTDKSAPGIGNLPKGLGLTLEAFVPTVWELIPYSFLIDYFINVNDLLKAYAVAGVSPVYAYKDVIRDTRETYFGGPPLTKDTFVPHSAGQHDQWSGTHVWEVRYRYLVRSDARNETGVPSLAITTSFPGLSRFLNIGALIGSRH